MTFPFHLPSCSLPSSEKIQHLWQELADRYFEARLPLISIVWSPRLTASAGMFVSRLGPRNRSVPVAVRQGASRVIRLSAPLLRGQPLEEVVRTLAHEMIHQWQFDIRQRRPDHGRDFLSMMHRMNQDGLGVSLYHHLDEAVQAWNRYAWRCVQCGYEYQRQRRTIRPKRHRCGQCGGQLEESNLNVAGLQVTVEPKPSRELVPPSQEKKSQTQDIGQLTLPF